MHSVVNLKNKNVNFVCYSIRDPIQFTKFKVPSLLALAQIVYIQFLYKDLCTHLTYVGTNFLHKV